MKSIKDRNILNDLSATEWIANTVSVWLQKGLGAGHPDAAIEKQHPAPFSFTDVSRLINFFTKRGQIVLDPFVGVGSTLKAAALEGRKSIGIELNRRFVKLSNERLKKEVKGLVKNKNGLVKIIHGDSRVVLKKMPTESVDFIVTSPPYWNILRSEDKKAKQERSEKGLITRYSNSKKDLGNITSYEDFLDELSVIVGQCYRLLRNKKYIAIVVSDFRKGPKYYMFHSDLAGRMEKAGFHLKGIKILYQSRKKVFPYGYPFSYVPNIHHQYIVIGQKT